MADTRDDAPEMPERIWAFEDYQGAVPRGGMWCDEQSECPEGSPQYVRSDLCASGQQVRALVDAIPADGSSLEAMRLALQDTPVGRAMISKGDVGLYWLNQGDVNAAILCAALTPAPQPEGLVLDWKDPANDEAMGWITANCMAIRRDSGALEYTLSQMVRAFQAGKAAAMTPAPDAAQTEATAICKGCGIEFRLGDGHHCDGPFANTPPAAQTEAVPVPVPVAWRCKDFADDWWLTTDKRVADEHLADGGAVQPLYAHPAAPAPGIAEARRWLYTALTRASDRLTLVTG